MIGRLSGVVAHDDASGELVIDVAGVGYEVTTPVGARGRAESNGPDHVVLFIHTHVREDSLNLFGFPSEQERRVFRLLIGVPNVGPKTALGVLSALPIEELSRAVEAFAKLLCVIPSGSLYAAESSSALSEISITRSSRVFFIRRVDANACAPAVFPCAQIDEVGVAAISALPIP